jgi:hypothetical protein
MANYQFRTTNIKGKEYVEVHERIKFFRLDEQYKGYCLESQIISITDDVVCIQAIIRNAEDRVVATGIAYEEKASSRINATSYVENCETSAWGRALANLGIGIETSIASSNEVINAIANQNQAVKSTATATPESNVFQQAVEYIKSAQGSAKETAYKQVISKYGGEFSEKQKDALLKFVPKAK